MTKKFRFPPSHEKDLVDNSFSSKWTERRRFKIKFDSKVIPYLNKRRITFTSINMTLAKFTHGFLARTNK